MEGGAQHFGLDHDMNIGTFCFSSLTHLSLSQYKRSKTLNFYFVAAAVCVSRSPTEKLHLFSILPMFLVSKRANGEQGKAGQIRAGKRPERPGRPRRPGRPGPGPGPGPATALGLCSAVARGTITPASVTNSGLNSWAD